MKKTISLRIAHDLYGYLEEYANNHRLNGISDAIRKILVDTITPAELDKFSDYIILVNERVANPESENLVEYSLEYDAVYYEFPNRHTRQPRTKGREAFIKWRMLNKDVDLMLVADAFNFYKEECIKSEIINTQYVKLISTFINSDLTDYIQELKDSRQRKDFLKNKS